MAYVPTPIWLDHNCKRILFRGVLAATNCSNIKRPNGKLLHHRIIILWLKIFGQYHAGNNLKIYSYNIFLFMPQVQWMDRDDLSFIAFQYSGWLCISGNLLKVFLWFCPSDSINLYFSDFENIFPLILSMLFLCIIASVPLRIHNLKIVFPWSDALCNLCISISN